MLNRREFLTATAAAVGTAAVSGCAANERRSAPDQAFAGGDTADWASIRGMFDLPRGKVHLAGFFLASVPRPVKAEIERHRTALDENAVGYWMAQRSVAEPAVRRIAGQYMDVAGEREIALTDSTSMGLGLLYSGLMVERGDEILTTEHDHRATHEALEFKARSCGAVVTKIRLYDRGADASADRIVAAVRDALKPRTRVLALTWVHSCTGVKLPLGRIGAVVREVNAKRPPAEKILYCVDGVHGFGIENATMPELGCDFFSAGTHKWMLGPRGTGVLWGREDAWSRVIPAIVSFSHDEGPGAEHTPGGFHTFEARWAAAAAFRFHLDMGKSRVTQRLHALNGRVREGLAAMKHVTLHTPLSEELASGITCFEVRGLDVHDVVDRLGARGIIASTSPYTPSYARLAACLWNTPEEVDTALREVERLA